MSWYGLGDADNDKFKSLGSGPKQQQDKAKPRSIGAKLANKQQAPAKTVGVRLANSHITGDADLIQGMIEDLYSARSEMAFRKIKRDFAKANPNLVDRMLKDITVMDAIPKVFTPVQEELKPSSFTGLVSNRSRSKEAIATKPMATPSRW